MSGIGLGKWHGALFGFSQKRGSPRSGRERVAQGKSAQPWELTRRLGKPASAGDSRWFGVMAFVLASASLLPTLSPADAGLRHLLLVSERHHRIDPRCS